MADNRIEVEIVLDDGSVQRGFANIRRQADESVGSVSGLSRAFNSLGRSILTFGATFLSLEAVKRTVTSFVDFERQLIAVGKTTDLSGRQLQLLGERFQVLSERIPVSANRLLEFAESAGQLGVRGSANLEKFADTLARLEVSTDIVGQEGARSLVRILNITKTGIGDIDRFGSAIVELGNNFAATEGEILSVANEVARGTAAFDVSAQEVLGLSTAIKALGGQAESAGTALGKTFRTISIAIASNNATLTQLTTILKTTRSELKDRFQKDSVSVFRDLINSLGRANLSSTQLTNKLKSLGLNNERVLKTIVPLIQNYETLNRTLDTASAEFERNTALSKESERAFKSLGSELSKLGNTITNIATDIGSKLAPAIATVSRGARLLIEDLKAAFTGRFDADPTINKIESVKNEIRLLSEELENQSRLVEQGGGSEQAIATLEQRIIQKNQLLTRLLQVQANQAKMANQELVESSRQSAEEIEKTAVDLSIRFAELIDFTPLVDKFKAGTELSEDELNKLNAIAKSELQQLQGSLKSVLVNGASNAFAAFGRSIVTGENGLKALGNQVLNTLGALAIQMGQFFILVGSGLTATQSILGVSGGAAIAAGAGLIALGGALQAVATGAGSDVGGGVGGGAIATGPTVADEIFEEEEIRQRQAQINLTIQGNVLDRRETGLEIVEILQEAFDTQQASVVTV